MTRTTTAVRLTKTGEMLPLRGIRLWRWKTALRIYRVGCWVSGRHEHLLEYDEIWKVRYCPHCGWIPNE